MTNAPRRYMLHICAWRGAYKLASSRFSTRLFAPSMRSRASCIEVCRSRPSTGVLGQAASKEGLVLRVGNMRGESGGCDDDTADIPVYIPPHGRKSRIRSREMCPARSRRAYDAIATLAPNGKARPGYCPVCDLLSCWTTSLCTYLQLNEQI